MNFKVLELDLGPGQRSKRVHFGNRGTRSSTWIPPWGPLSASESAAKSAPASVPAYLREEQFKYGNETHGENTQFM